MEESCFFKSDEKKRYTVNHSYWEVDMFVLMCIKMKNKCFGFAVIFCLLTQSCAILDISYSYKSSSEKWRKNRKTASASWNYYKDDEKLSFTYSYDSDTCVIYPNVGYVECLTGPFLIPFIPNIIPFSSGKNKRFSIMIKSNKWIFINDITCIINGTETAPENIAHQNQSTKFWEDYRYNDSAYICNQFLFPNTTPVKKDVCLQKRDTVHFFRYEYNVRQTMIKDIKLCIKDNPALHLKRKKGLQYVLLIIPPAYR
jgi:hypothetical protein